jgi:hypothetical protein
MRRCRACKEHHIPKDAPKSQWWGDDACKRAYMESKFAAKPTAKPTKAKPKKKQKTIAKLVDDAAVLLQKLVRMKAADSDGWCKCVTCGAIRQWKELQGGHLIERGKTAVKLLEEQVNPQCEGCNGFGMKYRPTVVLAYRRFMVERHGEDFVRWLEAEAFKVKKYTRHEVEAITFDFKRRIAQEEARLRGQTEQRNVA